MNPGDRTNEAYWRGYDEGSREATIEALTEEGEQITGRYVGGCVGGAMIGFGLFSMHDGATFASIATLIVGLILAFWAAWKERRDLRARIEALRAGEKTRTFRRWLESQANR